MRLSVMLLISTATIATNVSAEFKVIEEGVGPLPAMSQPALKDPGFVWKALKDGAAYQSTLISRSSGAESWRNSEGCEWVRSEVSPFAPATSWANCNGNSGTASVDERGNPWPLELGKEWSYSVNGGDWQTNRDCEVQDTVRVSSRFGDQATFEVVCKDKWSTRTWYFAPKLERAVYYEQHHRVRGWRKRFESMP